MRRTPIRIIALSKKSKSVVLILPMWKYDTPVKRSYQDASDRVIKLLDALSPYKVTHGFIEADLATSRVSELKLDLETIEV